MRAVVLERYGAPNEALVLHDDWPLPERRANQVLIQVAATSVNQGEWKLRQHFAPIPINLPKILGEDLAGVVIEAPEGSKFKKGDRVFAETGQALKSGDNGGTYAELVAADIDTVCALPPGVGFQEAAAVPCAGMTAWQALEPAMPLAGKRVLIHGGAGGVGGFAVQIAKAQGAHVTTTCSTRNVEFVTGELGADVAIDYTEPYTPGGPFGTGGHPSTKVTRAALQRLQGPWEQSEAARQQPFDFVLDTIGGPYQAASLRLLARDGLLASVGATGPDVKSVSVLGVLALLGGALLRTLLGWVRLGPRFKFVMQECKAARGLEQLAELMAQGKLKVHLDRVWPLEEMAAAHEYCEQGHVRGQVGILVKEM